MAVCYTGTEAMLWRVPHVAPMAKGGKWQFATFYPIAPFCTSLTFFNRSPISELRIQIHFRITNRNSLTNIGKNKTFIKKNGNRKDENHVR